MQRTQARNLLLEAADSAYKEFNDKIANCSIAPSIGVRVPAVRAIARQIVKEGWEEYLEEMEKIPPLAGLFAGQSEATEAQTGAYCPPSDETGGQRGDGEVLLYQEEHMLQGLVIGYAKMSDEQRARHLEQWIPGVLSWGDCDCSVSSFKFMNKNHEFWYTYNLSWLEKGYRRGQPFAVRVALVALMQYFINDSYIDRVLEAFAKPEAFLEGSGGAGGETSPDSCGSAPGKSGAGNSDFTPDAAYYIRMAQAWALSVCFVKYRDKTLRLFEEQKPEPWVQNKAIQKCRESYRVSAADKELLKTLKR